MRWLCYRETGASFITLSEKIAVDLFRACHGANGLSFGDEDCLQGFIAMKNAVFVRAPDNSDQRSLKEVAIKVVKKIGLLKGAKFIGCSPDYLRKLAEEGDAEPPKHMLRKLGIYKEIRYYEEPSATSQN